MSNTPNHFYNLRTIFDGWRSILIMRANLRHPCAKIIKELLGWCVGTPYIMLWTINSKRLTPNDHIPKTNALIKDELRKLGGRLTGNKAKLTENLIRERWRKRHIENNQRNWRTKKARREQHEDWYECENMGEV